MMGENSFSRVFNSLIGAESVYCGDLETEGLVRIDGLFEGAIKTNGPVIISKNARCNGFIQAHSIVVGGMVKGNIYTYQRVELLSGAVVVGDIFTTTLSTEQNVTIHGDCRIVGKGYSNLERALQDFISSHGGFPLRAKSEFLREALRSARGIPAEA
jgi:cytoskeletal protein CcmA (bactofilin family)